MKYLLDTNMVIYAQKRYPNVIENIKAHFEDGLCISVINLAELENGVEKSMYPERNRTALYTFLAPFEVIPFDNAAALEYGRICSNLTAQGNRIGEFDMLIAAHARSRGYTVVTHNTREFERVQGLQLEDWV